MLLRSTLATIHGQDPAPETAIIALDAAKAQFRHYALQLWADCRGHYIDPDEMVTSDPTPAGFATYPARCLTLIEILGMLALLELESAVDSALAQELGSYLRDFVSANIGTSHPFSDRWGISLVPVVLLFERQGLHELARSFLESCVKWVADYYDGNGFGLAGLYVTADKEVLYLLGSPFEGLPLRRRSESHIASTILDLASVSEQRELYDLAKNEFMAVDIVLPVVEADDEQGQYCMHVGKVRFEPNMPYRDYWEPANDWKHAPHHQRDQENRYPSTIAGPWALLAISCIVRDRNFVKNWRKLIGKLS